MDHEGTCARLTESENLVASSLGRGDTRDRSAHRERDLSSLGPARYSEWHLVPLSRKRIKTQLKSLRKKKDEEDLEGLAIIRKTRKAGEQDGYIDRETIEMSDSSNSPCTPNDVTLTRFWPQLSLPLRVTSSGFVKKEKKKSGRIVNCW